MTCRIDGGGTPTSLPKLSDTIKENRQKLQEFRAQQKTKDAENNQKSQQKWDTLEKQIETEMDKIKKEMEAEIKTEQKELQKKAVDADIKKTFGYDSTQQASPYQEADHERELERMRQETENELKAEQQAMLKEERKEDIRKAFGGGLP